MDRGTEGDEGSALRWWESYNKTSAGTMHQALTFVQQ